ncbi:MAG: hypothetical protein KAY65_04185 [Planctomycetes bacterium]|nr:hypothetical protein [Planctomycetota bacterium]
MNCIESLTDFDKFAPDANYWDDYTRLETDVNLAGLTYTTAVIAPDTDSSDGFQGTTFTGVFDGNDYKIAGLTVHDGGAGEDYLGLFGYIEGRKPSALSAGVVFFSFFRNRRQTSFHCPPIGTGNQPSSSAFTGGGLS